MGISGREKVAKGSGVNDTTDLQVLEQGVVVKFSREFMAYIGIWQKLD